jgi:hypothetical protein
MRPRRLLPLVAAVLVLPMLSPALASAGNRGEPIIADLNNDGLSDRATLGPDTGTPTGTPNCTINVELRRPNGTFRPPVVHTYASPLTRQPFCPNMGEAINLGRNGATELVLTHFVANQQPVLMVLKNFTVVARFDGLEFPSTIRSADFNGDGRVDIWESTDEVERLRTFTNTPDGTLVPGAIDVCSRDSIPQHVLADFNRDGGQDFLVVLNCGVTSSVQVLFGNGQAPVTLLSRDTTHLAFQAFQVDVNSDGIPDAGVIDHAADGTVTTRYFQNDGTGAFTEVAPFAAPAPSPAALATDQNRFRHN